MTTPDPAAPPVDLHDPTSCAGCGYALRGLAEARCPECGLPFDPKDPTAEIPWLYRGTLGRWDAFWATVRLAVLSPGRLAEQATRHVYVDPVAPPRFRTTCVTIGAAAVATMVVLAEMNRVPALRWSLAPPVWLASVGPAAVFFYFASIPLDLSGFDTVIEQVRFRRLYHFTAASIVLTVPALVAYGGLLVLRPQADPYLLALPVVACAGATWTFAIVHFQLRAARRVPGWAASHVCVIFLFWVLLAFFCVAGGSQLVQLAVGIAKRLMS